MAALAAKPLSSGSDLLDLVSAAVLPPRRPPPAAFVVCAVLSDASATRVRLGTATFDGEAYELTDSSLRLNVDAEQEDGFFHVGESRYVIVPKAEYASRQKGVHSSPPDVKAPAQALQHTTAPPPAPRLVPTVCTVHSNATKLRK